MEKRPQFWQKYETTSEKWIYFFPFNASALSLSLYYIRVNINKVRLHSVEMRVAKSAECAERNDKKISSKYLPLTECSEVEFTRQDEIYRNSHREMTRKKAMRYNRYDIAYNCNCICNVERTDFTTLNKCDIFNLHAILCQHITNRMHNKVKN